MVEKLKWPLTSPPAWILYSHDTICCSSHFERRGERRRERGGGVIHGNRGRTEGSPSTPCRLLEGSVLDQLGISMTVRGLVRHGQEVQRLLLHPAIAAVIDILEDDAILVARSSITTGRGNGKCNGGNSSSKQWKRQE